MAGLNVDQLETPLWGKSELEAEIRALTLDRYGLHLHDLTAVTCYARNEPEELGCVFDGEFEGELARGERTVEGVPVVDWGRDVSVAMTGGRLMVGSREGVARLLAVAAKKEKSLADVGGDSPHHALVSKIEGTALAVTANTRWLPPEARAVLGGEENRGVAVGINGQGEFTGVVWATAGAMGTLAGLINGGLDIASTHIQAEKTEATASGTTTDAMGAIFASFALKQFRDALTVNHDGEHLELSLRIQSAPTILPVAGLLSAIAVPAFIRYTDRAREMQIELDERKREQERQIEELREVAPREIE
jgi:hypothetical protein